MSRILGNDTFTDANPHSYAGLVQRLQMLRDQGWAAARCVSYRRRRSSGSAGSRAAPTRTPRSRTRSTSCMRCGRDAAGSRSRTPDAFSHQWLRPNWCEAKKADLAWGSPERAQAADEGLIVGDVDSADHEKAKALGKWAKWLVWTSSRKAHRWISRCRPQTSSSTSWRRPCTPPSPPPPPTRTLWPSSSRPTSRSTSGSTTARRCRTRETPAQIVPYMAALPAAVAVCAVVATYWTEAYESRAWCQTEMLMGYAFVSTGDKLWIVPRGFEHGEQDVRERRRTSRLPAPATATTAQLTNGSIGGGGGGARPGRGGGERRADPGAPACTSANEDDTLVVHLTDAAGAWRGGQCAWINARQVRHRRNRS